MSFRGNEFRGGTPPIAACGFAPDGKDGKRLLEEIERKLRLTVDGEKPFLKRRNDEEQNNLHGNINFHGSSCMGNGYRTYG